MISKEHAATGTVNLSEGKQIWILAGEASGDLYGARLALALLSRAPALRIRGMGGKEMNKAGVEILVDSTNLGIVGLVEVLKHLRLFRQLFHQLVTQAAAERPEAVVLIDYPGFNLRFAKEMHRLGIKVVYYVSPQVWAWGRKRIKLIAEYVDKLIVIFPFEKEVFAGTGLDVEFIGHPLLEIMHAKRDPSLEADPNTVLLLPGSRVHEVESLLPPMLATAAWLDQRQSGLRYVIAIPGAKEVQAVRAIARRMQGILNLEIVEGHTHEWMQRSCAAIAASGTVTLEAAILGLPVVVVYKLNPLTYRLARMLVKVPYFAIVNLIAAKSVFDEFLQGDVRPERLGPALLAILPGGRRRAEVEQGMRLAVGKLGDAKQVSMRVAQSILTLCPSVNV